MPTTMLSQNNSARLSARPLQIVVETEGSMVPIDLVVSPAVQTVRPRSGMVVLPRLGDGPVTVSVVPVGGGVFPMPTILHLTAFVAETAQTEPDRVVTPGIVVSGRSAMDLLIVEQVGAELVLRSADGLGDPTLSALGEAALVAGRTVLGAARRDPADLEPVTIEIDTSASMEPRFADGSVYAAVEIISGLLPLMSAEMVVNVRLAGRPSARVTDLAGLSAHVEDQLAHETWSTGFMAGASASVDRGVTFVITDSAPANLDDGAAGDVHVVVLAQQDLEPVLRSETPGRFTVIPPESADHQVSTRLAGNPAWLNDVMRGLLSPAAGGQ